MPNDTALTRVIGLLYSMERDDITALAAMSNDVWDELVNGDV